MRIGIMTFWESQDNYGQQLQAFALQTFLRQLGHDAFLIKYHRHGSVPPRKTLLQRIVQFNPIKSAKARIAHSKLRKFSAFEQAHPRHFNSFKDNRLVFGDRLYTSLDELMTFPPKADAYICGSDQIWNNTFSVSCEPYLLGFGDLKTKRIAYAASFGQKVLSADTLRLFRRYLPKFDAVSVREKSGLTLCKKIGYTNAIWVPDPTLLFDKSHWTSLLKNDKEFDRKKNTQLFLYTLGNSKINHREQIIHYLKNKEAVDTLHVSANRDMSGDYFPRVEEWVHAISQSDYLVTNSFHGAVFSILFNKNFIVLPNTGVATGMNERVLSLLEKLNLTEHLLWQFDPQRIDFLLQKKIPWAKINADIASWREDARQFLKSALGE
ncbi:polysaccharide pyruvyl transferase family protein [Olivibacter sp. CPCC 100613]|uniref:polysaccharide pyruvyl transferase family protein n=1 Tax=Olivibacter sp. CPCC 100613 TaxID=3079931 RepID=UPI002FF967D3